MSKLKFYKSVVLFLTIISIFMYMCLSGSIFSYAINAAEKQTWEYNGISYEVTIFENGCVDILLTDNSYMYPTSKKYESEVSSCPMNFPVPHNGRIYCLSTIGKYQAENAWIFAANNTLKVYSELSYYPDTYNMITDENIDYTYRYQSSYGEYSTAQVVKYCNQQGWDMYRGYTTKMYESVPILTFNSGTHTTGKITFSPSINTPSGTYEFALFSKKFTVDYTNPTDIPDNQSILSLDVDSNGIIDAKDASILLRIYAINSTGGNIHTLDDLKNYK